MRVYKFLTRDFAIKTLRERRVKISEINDLNDPFELVPFDLSDSVFREAMLRTRDELNVNRGMVCFASHWSNPVLWAHYSDKHRGMCLGFDVPDDVAKSVQYKAARLPQRAPDLDMVQDMLFTKFAGWEYENEIRIYAEREEEDGGLYFVDFSERLKLREVIAGHRCCAARSDVMNVLRGYPEPISLIKACLSRTSFCVVEDPDGFKD
jgi:hypothetical protein